MIEKYRSGRENVQGFVSSGRDNKCLRLDMKNAGGGKEI